MEMFLRTKLRGILRGRLHWLFLLAAGLLLLCRLRSGVAVSVDGVELGTYAPRVAMQCMEAAEAAAYEIVGETVDLRESVELRFCLTLRPREKDRRRLERALLAAAPGIERLWVVYAGEKPLGAVDDPSALGELQRVLVRSHAGPYTVAARLEPELTLRRSFVRSSAVLSQEELGRRLRQYVTVRTVDMAQEALPAAQHGIVVEEYRENA